jgi:hypothetical protein
MLGAPPHKAPPDVKLARARQKIGVGDVGLDDMRLWLAVNKTEQLRQIAADANPVAWGRLGNDGKTTPMRVDDAAKRP